MFSNFKEEVVKLLEGAGVKVSVKDIEEPPDPKMGDLAFPCFSLAKEMKKNPAELAKEISEKIKIPEASIIEKVVVSGPYINFFFNRGKFTEKVVNEVLKSNENYGSENWNEKIVVEYPSPNTNKPLHLGHMRNMAIGEAISRIFEKLGCRVFRVNLHNDRGIHICKSMLAYKKWGDDREPDKKPDHFVGDFYVLFSQRVKENPKLEEEAREMLRKWEAGDKETLELWKKLTSWVEKGFEETYRRFGVRFDKIYRESEMYKKGKEMVLEGLKKGIFQKDETGAIFFDLSKYGLDKKILIRSDGTTLYITQDLYLAYLKYIDFSPDKSIYVVANEQNYHFEVLFKLLEELKKLGYKFPKENIHLNYGMVNLPSGKMKSREGEVVDADDLMDEMKERAMKEIEKRNVLSEEKLDELSHKISLAAIKFFLLKYDEYKDFTFYPEESLSLEGETGPYLQYSLVRAKKILEKIESKPKVGELTEDEEFYLAKKISKFPDVVKSAAIHYKPHFVANYAFELASLFSRFYESCRVIKSEKEGERAALVKAFEIVMKLSLNLLGIEEVDLM